MKHIPMTVRLMLTALCALAGCHKTPPAPDVADTKPRDVQLYSPVPTPFTPTADNAAAQITADELRKHVAALSSDAFEGRGPATRADLKTRAYLKDQLQALGYQPGGVDGGWEQPFELVGIEAKAPKQWVFQKGKQQAAFAGWSDFIATSGVQQPAAAIANAEVVFVGYGIQAPEYQWDDFKEQDLKGKVLLMLNNDPDWDPTLFAGTTRLYYGRWSYKYANAARQGAVGAIIIHTTASAGYPFQVVQTSWSGPQFELPAGTEPQLQVRSWLTEAAARKLATLSGHNLDELIQAARSRDFKPVPLGVTTSLKLANTLKRVQTANVLGLLPGSDPEAAKDVVVYTAHHDHLGLGQPDAHGDRTYNGALDNAAGDAQVLAIAKAYKALITPPKRSVLILLVGAEEQGLLGSKYYAAHPTVPAGHIAADINYDGGNIWGRTRDVTSVGKGRSTLDEAVDKVAARQGRVVQPDPFPDRGYFYRSDQFSFAQIGVPVLYLNTGTDFVGRPAGWGRQQIEDYEAHRYHQPSDELRSDWNFDGMIEDAQLGFWVGLITAEADQLPSWTPGDEFEAARKQAIAATTR